MLKLTGLKQKTNIFTYIDPKNFLYSLYISSVCKAHSTFIVIVTLTWRLNSNQTLKCNKKYVNIKKK